MTAQHAPDDSPLPAFSVPVTFVDGTLAGQTVMVPNDRHHYADRQTGEIWRRYSEAPDGVLRAFFRLKLPQTTCPACGGTGHAANFKLENK